MAYYKNKRSGTIWYVVDRWEGVNLDLPEGSDSEMCYRLSRTGKSTYRYIWQSELDKLFTEYIPEVRYA